MYLTSYYSDYLTGFHEPVSPPYKSHTGLKKKKKKKRSGVITAKSCVWCWVVPLPELHLYYNLVKLSASVTSALCDFHSRTQQN